MAWHSLDDKVVSRVLVHLGCGVVAVVLVEVLGQ